MMNTQDVKQRLFALGADLCGVATIDRFSEAPEGYHPTDVLPACKSVIVFAKRFLAGTLACQTTAPYFVVRNTLSAKLDDMAVAFCDGLEREGILAVPTGTIGPTDFDERTGRYRNPISAKHAAQAAGLGVIGKNTLLITPEYGNMVWLHAILTELELEPDPKLTRDYCKDCDLCIKACPVDALGDPAMAQTKCSGYMFGADHGGDYTIKCYKCRSSCPYALGEKNGGMKRESGC